MNECLTTPQHEKQIGYWVSEKDLKMIKKAFREGFFWLHTDFVNKGYFIFNANNNCSFKKNILQKS